jgi:putative N6-adenine-specific DNA methylase
MSEEQLIPDEAEEPNVNGDEYFQQTAKTYQGLENLLAEELKAIGVTDIKVGARSVTYNGTKKHLYQANYLCRTALSVLVPIDAFTAEDPEELYKKAMRIEWDDFFHAGNTFAIHPTISSDYFPHSQFASLRLKDAIVDFFRNKTGKRPSVAKEDPEFRINLHIRKNAVTISFDSSGEPLFKRGYRQRTTEATLNEILASGMIMLTGWDGKTNLIDPMCGSGTICAEAAMIALNMPAGYFRRSFGFMHWPDFDRQLWQEVKAETKSSIKKSSDCLIIGADLSYENVEKAKINLQQFRLNQLRLIVKDFFDFQLPDKEPAIIIMNPPYGERLHATTDLDVLYKHIGDHLKKNFIGCEAWIISSNIDALKHLGLHSSRKITLYNGPLECKFQQFKLYEGSQKSTKIE